MNTSDVSVKACKFIKEHKKELCNRFASKYVLDCVLKNKQDFLLDATFADLQKSYNNITRCLRRNRKVGITYTYQDPLVALN